MWRENHFAENVVFALLPYFARFLQHAIIYQVFSWVIEDVFVIIFTLYLIQRQRLSASFHLACSFDVQYIT